MAVCGGNAETAKRQMKHAIKLSVGKLEPTPLEYRWKGMERFACKVFRGRQQHDIYLGVVQKMWPASLTRRSEEALAALAARDDDSISNDALRHKANIRGGQTVDWMEQDADGNQVKVSIIYSSGIQLYLNKCVAADALVTKYTTLLQNVPNQLRNVSDMSKALSSDVAELREKCIAANLHILSGAAADVVFSHYSAFFDFESESWAGWDVPCHGQRFTICCRIIMVLQDCFYRLHFKVNLPKVNILEVARLDLDGSDDILAAVASIVQPLREKANRCDKCVDGTFTLPWIARLLDYGPATAKQAWLSIGDIVSVVRVSSSLVEKKHLVGQEAKPRKRGICVTAYEVGAFVFRKLVEKASESTRAAATHDCLDEHFHQISSCLTDLLAQGHGDRRSEVAAASADVPADGASQSGFGLGKRCRNLLSLDSKLKRQRV